MMVQIVNLNDGPDCSDAPYISAELSDNSDSDLESNKGPMCDVESLSKKKFGNGLLMSEMCTILRSMYPYTHVFTYPCIHVSMYPCIHVSMYTMFDQVIETCTDIETVDYLCIHLL